MSGLKYFFFKVNDCKSPTAVSAASQWYLNYKCKINVYFPQKGVSDTVFISNYNKSDTLFLLRLKHFKNKKCFLLCQWNT